MNENEIANKVIHVIAKSFYDINSFVCDMNRNSNFNIIVPSTDIQLYESGWKCEMYLEYKIEGNNDLFATWSLEVYFRDSVWHVDVDTSITHGEYSEEIASLEENSIDGLSQILNVALDKIRESTKEDSAFNYAIQRESSQFDHSEE